MFLNHVLFKPLRFVSFVFCLFLLLLFLLLMKMMCLTQPILFVFCLFFEGNNFCQCVVIPAQLEVSLILNPFPAEGFVCSLLWGQFPPKNVYSLERLQSWLQEL